MILAKNPKNVLKLNFITNNLKNIHWFMYSFIPRSFLIPFNNNSVISTLKYSKYLNSPVNSNIYNNSPHERTKINKDTIAHLERLSLVDCANKKGIGVLEAAIAFADQIQNIDTTNVEPLITVLEDRPLELREDIITDGNYRTNILSNATITREEYFVAPPGNIPIQPRKDLLYEQTENKNKS